MIEGVLLLDKPVSWSSFGPIPRIRRLSGVAKVGHAGTLDPFATGLMIYLIGRQYTKLATALSHNNKRYLAQLRLGIKTTTYDLTGEPVEGGSSIVPTLDQIKDALNVFQGRLLQVPPMFSAKKIAGKRLYKLARQGLEVVRAPCEVEVAITLVEYHYPLIKLDITCSKGTYIRSLAHDLGEVLGCGAHLHSLRRTASGSFIVDQAFTLEELTDVNALLRMVIQPKELL